MHIPQTGAHLLLMPYPLLDLDVQVNNCLVEHYVVVGHALLPECGMPHYPLSRGLSVLLTTAQTSPLVVAQILQARPLGSTVGNLALRG